MKKKYRFTPKILQTKDGDAFILSLQKENDEGKHFYSESFSSLADATAALNFLHWRLLKFAEKIQSRR